VPADKVFFRFSLIGHFNDKSIVYQATKLHVNKSMENMADFLAFLLQTD